MSAAASEVRVRPGTIGDNEACSAILVAAINDLGRRNGSFVDRFALDPVVQWPRLRSFFDHVARTAAEFWVAEDIDGNRIGYARSIARGGLFELTEFFVRPGVQSRGVGGELLERAFPAGRGELRVIIATTDIRALSRYLRAGVVARFPILSFTGSSRAPSGDGGLDVEPIDVEHDLEALAAIDEGVLGHRRDIDRRWFASEREGYRYRRDGRTVGYGYVARPDRSGSGPFAVLEPDDLPAAMLHAEGRRQELGAEETDFEVPLHNRAAIDHLLSRGYRMDNFMTLLCSSEPFGRFDRYVCCRPALIL